MRQYIPSHPNMGQRSQFQSQGVARAPSVTQVGQRGHTMGQPEDEAHKQGR